MMSIRNILKSCAGNRTFEKTVKTILLFLAGSATVFGIVFYLSWGTMGFMVDGDFLGMTRMFSLVGGGFFVLIWYGKL